MGYLTPVLVLFAEGVIRALKACPERSEGAGSAKTRALKGSSRPSGRAQWPSRPFRARIIQTNASLLRNPSAMILKLDCNLRGTGFR